jgi:lysophospholipase L1-like esterase
LDSVAARIIRDVPADLISLCIGINIWGHASFGRRSFASAACGFIETIRDGHPDTPVVVMTPIASPARELLANAVGMTLSDYREELRTAVATMQDLGDANLHLIDGLDVLGVADLSLLTDGVHPSGEGYRLIADRVAPALGQLMGAPRGR